MYRELIQNANDATATEIEFQFLSDESGNISRIKVNNNGTRFADVDWARIVNIGSGNDGQKKVGGFGVGFYS
ncbi:hypothetical protein HK100_008777, partial [Physocladia obscura]